MLKPFLILSCRGANRRFRVTPAGAATGYCPSGCPPG